MMVVTKYTKPFVEVILRRLGAEAEAASFEKKKLNLKKNKIGFVAC
jgi:hypothetical protein